MKLSLKDDLYSVSYFRSHFTEMLRTLESTRRPAIITHSGKPAGVFMDITAWEAHLRGINLLIALNQAEVSLAHDKTFTLQEIEDYFTEKYES